MKNSLTYNDYTELIPLWRSDFVLLVNFATGKVWIGNRERISEGTHKVENSKGTAVVSRDLSDLNTQYHYKCDYLGLEIILVPTYYCNMNCLYCYEGRLTKLKHSWNISDIDQVVKSIFSICDNFSISGKEPRITFLGGEIIQESLFPLLDKLIDKIRQFSTKQNIYFVTNGLEVENWFRRVDHSFVSGVQITLDGPPEIHNRRRKSKTHKNSFEKILAGIKLLLNNEINVDCRINIDVDNVRSLFKLIDIFQKEGLLGHKKFHPFMYPLSYSGVNKRQQFLSEIDLILMISELYKHHSNYAEIRWAFHGMDFFYKVFGIFSNKSKYTPKFRFCAGNVNQFLVDPFKNLYTCWHASDGGKGLAIGRLNESGYTLDEERLNEWRKRSITTLTKCNSCKYALICGGGCAFKSLSAYGSLQYPVCSDFANIFKTCVPILIDHYNLYNY